MDNLNTARTNAETAASDASKIATDIPGMLSGLKTNLTSIFTKDNPMFADRENALQTFLNAPSQTRADLLPGNQPIIGGSALNFSPTQQDAQVTAARNAALVPLAGLNQSIVGQYGNLNDIIGNAGNMFATQAKAAQDKAANALDLYKTAVSEYNALHSNANSGGFGDLAALIQTILSGNQNGGNKPPISSFDTPDSTTDNFTGSQPLSSLGIGSDQLGGQTIAHIGPGGQPIAPSGLDFGNIPINLGVNNGSGLSLAGIPSNSLGGTGLQFRL